MLEEYEKEYLETKKTGVSHREKTKSIQINWQNLQCRVKGSTKNISTMIKMMDTRNRKLP